MLQYAGENISEVTSLFDDVIDRINSLENLLAERADINLDIDHKFMEEAYFNLLNGTSGASADGNPAISDEDSVNIDELADGLEQIIEFAGLEEETAESLRTDIEAFIALPDKFSTDEDVRKLRRSIIKVYYDLYKQVFLKDYNSGEKTPIVIDLFLRYGFLSERLLTEDLQRELLALDNTDSGTGSCAVYDMKEWLTLILQGEKEPSKSEFDLDYDANLREMRSLIMKFKICSAATIVSCLDRYRHLFHFCSQRDVLIQLSAVIYLRIKLMRLCSAFCTLIIPYFTVKVFMQKREASLQRNIYRKKYFRMFLLCHVMVARVLCGRS